MKRLARKFTIGRTGGAGLFAIGGLGLLVSSASDRPAVPVVPAAAAEAAFRPGNGTVTDLISQLQAKLRLNPQDARSFASLGIAYVQQARMYADPTYYPKAQGTLRRSLSLQPADNFGADVGMGTLPRSRGPARLLGRAAVRPSSAHDRALQRQRSRRHR